MGEQERQAFQNSLRNHTLSQQKQNEIANKYSNKQGTSNNPSPDKGQRERNRGMER